MGKYIDLSGRRFGRLSVLCLHGKKPNGYHANGTPLYKLTWLCQCDCGTTAVVNGKELRNGESRSCGCLKAEELGDRSRTHGMTRQREYRSWQAMKERCHNPSHWKYKDYGGRGIAVCNRWLNSFENFYEDMGKCPARFTLDRINIDGNYEPSNCRWADAVTQAKNRRGVGYFWKGVKRTIKEIAEMEGVPRTSLNRQLASCGLGLEDALDYCIRHRRIKV